MVQLPAPSCTTDVYLAAVIERLDALAALLQQPAAPPAAPTRKRTTVKEAPHG